MSSQFRNLTHVKKLVIADKLDSTLQLAYQRKQKDTRLDYYPLILFFSAERKISYINDYGNLEASAIEMFVHGKERLKHQDALFILVEYILDMYGFSVDFDQNELNQAINDISIDFEYRFLKLYEKE